LQRSLHQASRLGDRQRRNPSGTAASFGPSSQSPTEGDNVQTHSPARNYQRSHRGEMLGPWLLLSMAVVVLAISVLVFVSV
jgi:hypothetical protein